MRSFLSEPLEFENVREFLEAEHDRFNNKSFIDEDPISIPHRYTDKEDIEISGFITATIAWGQRPVILRNAVRFMEWMDDRPAAFVRNASEDELSKLSQFVHRTFNGVDAIYFVKALRMIYKNNGGLEGVFMDALKMYPERMDAVIGSVRNVFFDGMNPGRTGKHFADPLSGSSAKRLNMFLRWMVRSDRRGVDFGWWKQFPAAADRKSTRLNSSHT